MDNEPKVPVSQDPNELNPQHVQDAVKRVLDQQGQEGQGNSELRAMEDRMFELRRDNSEEAQAEYAELRMRYDAAILGSLDDGPRPPVV